MRGQFQGALALAAVVLVCAAGGAEPTSGRSRPEDAQSTDASAGITGEREIAQGGYQENEDRSRALTWRSRRSSSLEQPPRRHHLQCPVVKSGGETARRTLQDRRP
jgi:hypothetical protein